MLFARISSVAAVVKFYVCIIYIISRPLVYIHAYKNPSRTIRTLDRTNLNTNYNLLVLRSIHAHAPTYFQYYSCAT